MSDFYKILVVEDESVLNSALCQKLESVGYETFAVNDGEKGLNVAINALPDCIVLDLIMPHMGGIEMLKRLRTSKGCAEIPVIILTNIDNTGDIREINDDPKAWAFVKSNTSLTDILVAIRGVISV